MKPKRWILLVMMKTSSDNNTEEQWVSKSQKKRDCNALQRIGDKLLKLKPDELALIELPAELADALNEAHRIHSNSALKRQRQYLGKIMRTCDHEEIQARKYAERALQALFRGGHERNHFQGKFQHWPQGAQD